MLGFSEPGALNYYTLFRLIPLTLQHLYPGIKLNLSSSFRIPGFSALQSHGTHSQSGIFSTDAADASGSVIIFIKQGLFFSELSTSSLSSLGPHSNYVEVNISLNDSSSLSFLNVYAPSIRSFTKDSRTNFFSPSILPSYVQGKAVDFSTFGFLRKSTASSSSFRFHIPDLNCCNKAVYIKVS